jgi:molybdopterin converting factor small subunit
VQPLEVLGCSFLPKIYFVGHLKEVFGSDFIEVKAEKLSEALKDLSFKVTDFLDLDGKPSGKYIFLINGADSSLYGDDPYINEGDVVTIVPISHGG